MLVYLLCAQEKEKYVGEYAPEVLAACDEYTLNASDLDFHIRATK